METRKEIELLRCCAALSLTPEREARARGLLREGLDWDLLLLEAQRHGLTPLVERHLCGPLADLVPVEHADKLRITHRHNAVRNLYLTGELCRLLDLFERKGINALVYKGPAVAFDAYGDLSLRQFGDLDLIIRPADLQRVTELLVAEGYEPEFELSGRREAAFKRLWYVQPFLSAKTKITLEIHWAVAPHFFAFDLQPEELMKRERRIALGDCSARVPSVQDTLLLLCVHGAKDTWARLEWICAVAEFVRRHEIDWDATMRQARRLGAERILLLGLKLARELSDVVLPDSIVERIESAPSLKSLSARVNRELSQREKSFQRFFDRATFHLLVRERPADRARYCVRTATATSPSEWDLLPLPQRLFFLYALVRPLRFAKGLLGNVASRRREAGAQASRPSDGGDARLPDGHV